MLRFETRCLFEIVVGELIVKSNPHIKSVAQTLANSPTSVCSRSLGVLFVCALACLVRCLVCYVCFVCVLYVSAYISLVSMLNM